jgi:hypothetical protein
MRGKCFSRAKVEGSVSKKELRALREKNLALSAAAFTFKESEDGIWEVIPPAKPQSATLSETPQNYVQRNVIELRLPKTNHTFDRRSFLDEVKEAIACRNGALAA